MNLSVEQIKSITCGAAQILEEGGGLRFWRFTEHQQELYSQLRPVLTKIKNYRPTSTTSSGVRLAFRTDSCHLGLKVDVFRGSPRTFFSFDVLVDGQYYDSMDNFGENIYPQGEPKTVYPLGIHEKEFTLPAGEKLVEIYFPWSVCPILQTLTLDDGATLTPVKRSKTYLAFGDSITQGYDILRPSRHHIPTAAKLLDADLTNKGIGGEYFFPPLADSPDDFQPDYITVAYGTNDLVHVDGTHFDEDVKTFFTSLRKHYPNAKIACITPIWRATFDGANNFDTIENLEKRMAAAVADVPGVKVVRGYEFVPQDTALLSDLSTHPNDEGFAYYCKNFWEGIKNAFDL
jgi:lysophospholipase L1-like esterase